MRGADCWTDHYLVRLKVLLALPNSRRRPFQAPKRLTFAVEQLSDPSIRQQFSQRVTDRLLDQAHLDSAPAVDQWNALKDTVCTAAKDILGLRRKKLPDWFHASSTVLLPLIDAKNAGRVKLLQQDSASARRHFRQTQRAVAQAVRQAPRKLGLKMLRLKQNKQDPMTLLAGMQFASYRQYTVAVVRSRLQLFFSRMVL